MTMTFRDNRKDFGILLGTIDDYVPQDHPVRRMEETIDWGFLYPKVSPLYSSKGRPSIDPVVLFKMIFINYTFGINSMRKTCEEIRVNLAYRWFLGISLDDPVPNYSTWSQNYIRRYGDSEVFDEIFSHILFQALERGYIDPGCVFADSTHQKASANKRKYTDREAELLSRAYEEDLLKEINEERRSHGKKPLKHIRRNEIIYGGKGEEVCISGKKKHIKESLTDPESGLYHKGEKEKCFAYSLQTFCDRKGYVLLSKASAGNVHDSSSFFEAYEDLCSVFGEKISYVCLDAGYNTSAVCRDIYRKGHIPVLPYSRPKGDRKEGMRKKDFLYDEETDSYICPQGCLLEYSSVNREGYRQYRCRSCRGCPLKKECTASSSKVLSVHIWEHYRRDADSFRRSSEWASIYPLRKQTIERVFADGKENHCLRYTRLRGLKKNRHQALVIFACHNLKKMGLAEWKRKKRERTDKTSVSFSYTISRLSGNFPEKRPSSRYDIREMTV